MEKTPTPIPIVVGIIIFKLELLEAEEGIAGVELLEVEEGEVIIKERLLTEELLAVVGVELA